MRAQMVLRRKPSTSTSSKREFFTAIAVLSLALAVAAALFAIPAWAQSLSVTQSDSPDPVTVGEDLTYDITVSSNGATNVVLTDPLPDNTRFRSATSAGNTCTTTGQGDNSGTITCQLGNISGRETVQIVVRPTAAAAAAGSVTNQPTANSQPAANSQNKLTFTAKSNPATTKVSKNNKNKNKNKNNKNKNKNNKNKNNKNKNNKHRKHRHNNNNRRNGIFQYDNSRFPPGIFSRQYSRQYEDTSGVISGSSQQSIGEATSANGGVSASSGPGGAEASTPGAVARSGNPDQQQPVSSPQGNIVNEVPTQGPLPNTGGLSFLAVVLPVAGFLMLALAVIYRVRESLRENR